jgi:hypothetical protein
MTSRSNADGSGRRIDVSMVYPSTVTGSDGKVSVANKLPISVSALVPMGMPTIDVNEAVSQLLNIMADTLVKDSFKTGFAPT